MKVEFLNQFTQTFEVDGHITVEVFRTHKTLEKLIEALDSDGRVTDGDWSYDGVVACVYGIIADSNGDINRVREFNKKKNHVKFGDKGYHTLNEVLDADLAWIREYGIVEDKEDFKKKFEDAAQKK